MTKKALSQLNQVSTLSTQDIIPILDVSETDNSLKNKTTSVQQIIDLVQGGYISPGNVIEVAKSGREFSNLKNAVEAYFQRNLGVNGLIIVYPGFYSESTINILSSQDINIYLHSGVTIETKVVNESDFDNPIFVLCFIEPA